MHLFVRDHNRNFTLRSQIGATEIELESEANDNLEMFRKISFYSELPKEGPTFNSNLVSLSQNT